MNEVISRVEREIDNYGRIIIPNELREGAGINKGSTVVLSVRANGALVIENPKALAASRAKLEWGLQLLAEQLGKDILVCDLNTVIAESRTAQAHHNREISPELWRLLSKSNQYVYNEGKKICPLLNSPVPVLAAVSILQNGKAVGAFLVLADAELTALEVPDQQELVVLDNAVKILQSQL